MTPKTTVARISTDLSIWPSLRLLWHRSFSIHADGTGGRVLRSITRLIRQYGQHRRREEAQSRWRPSRGIAGRAECGRVTQVAESILTLWRNHSHPNGPH